MSGGGHGDDVLIGSGISGGVAPLVFVACGGHHHDPTLVCIGNGILQGLRKIGAAQA